MAGTYPDVPGSRFLYDIDGSNVLRSYNGATPVAQDPTILNDEDADGNSQSTGYQLATDYIIAFPEPRGITGIFVMTSANSFDSLTLLYSTDTTDGTDGTWQTFGAITGWSSAPLPDSRNSIQPLNLTGVTGVKIRHSNSGSGSAQTLMMQAIHLYGTTPVTASTDRLEFWHPTDDAIVPPAQLDFGDVPQGSQVVKTLRVKNLSTTKTATSVTLSANNANGTDLGLANGITFSLDGTNYASTVTVPSLAPGAISPVIYVKRTVGAQEVASLRFARVLATPAAYA